MTFPIFDPLPVPPLEIPETAQRARDRAEAARELVAGPSSTGTTPGLEPNRTPTQAAVLVPVPARLLVAAPAAEKKTVTIQPVR